MKKDIPNFIKIIFLGVFLGLSAGYIYAINTQSYTIECPPGCNVARMVDVSSTPQVKGAGAANGSLLYVNGGLLSSSMMVFNNAAISGSLTVYNLGSGTTPSKLCSDINGNIQYCPLDYPLIVNKLGTGSGTVTSNVGGINCGSTCGVKYSSGTEIILTETETSGSTFGGWSAGCSSGGGMTRTCTVNTTDTTTTISATFYPACPNGGARVNGYCWYNNPTTGGTCGSYCTSIGRSCVNSSQTCLQDKAVYSALGISCSNFEYNSAYNSSYPNYNGHSCGVRTNVVWSCGTGSVATSSCTSSRTYYNTLCTCY